MLFHLARTLVELGHREAGMARLDQARGIDETVGVFTEEEQKEIDDLAGRLSG